VDKIAAAALVEEEAVASPNRNAAVAYPTTPETRAEKIQRAHDLIDGGMSLRKASRECGITRQLIRVLVLRSAQHYLAFFFNNIMSTKFSI
jgi:hypothetical protein